MADSAPSPASVSGWTSLSASISAQGEEYGSNSLDTTLWYVSCIEKPSAPEELPAISCEQQHACTKTIGVARLVHDDEDGPDEQAPSPLATTVPAVSDEPTQRDPFCCTIQA